MSRAEARSAPLYLGYPTVQGECVKKRFRDLIEYLEYDELIKVRMDLEKGGVQVARLIDSKIEQEIRKYNIFCATCSEKLDLYHFNHFTLFFGPQDLQRRASFCALDCLEYFLKNLRQLQQEDGQTQNQQQSQQQRGEACTTTKPSRKFMKELTFEQVKRKTL